ncbi:hypothetical protein JIN84_05835 [Luteolibacter yonseiensis]|uniref:Glycosyl transferase n=1 Tax=Luteolibacter yonseiensis TaxID=1144680 RepID=A0A934V6K1_9BACT|nr:hypothetical protein [Luteolibacter yonseiensis]MBK1815122.1 hypothetical protein [Luteolibacter yonseiensis]
MVAEDHEEGFLLLSTGDGRKQWLFNLIESIREFYPEAPVHVLTDAPVDVPHTLIGAGTGLDSRFYKTRLYHHSPFGRTIFLDDDTIVNGCFGMLEGLLDGWDVGMALDPFATLGLWRDNVLRNCMGHFPGWDAFVGYVDGVKEDRPFFNSGVMVWRRGEVARRLFDRWHGLWRDGGRGPDQTWLARAVLELEVEVRVLPQEMNFYPVEGHRFGHGSYPRAEEAKVIHYLSHHGKRVMEEAGRRAPFHRAYLEHVAGRG